MRTLYLDCGMGAAGDMLAAALLELLPVGEAADAVAELNALGIPGVTFTREAAEKCGIRGTHVTVCVNGEIEGTTDGTHHDHAAHHHDHAAHHHDHAAHHHAGMHDIEHIVNHLNITEKVRADVLAVYGLIADAESHVHGIPVEQIHFHEVGSLDAVADVTAVCLLMDRLAPEQVVASPVSVGSGSVECAHGTLPVPAPATAYLLEGIPAYGSKIVGELCTPTGAALLRYFVTSFGPMPAMRTTAIGYGMGTKDFPTANCVRALLGETAPSAEVIVELCCTLDDMTPEDVAFAEERFFAAGALEAYTAPVQMKKSRPGVLLTVMCVESKRDLMVDLMFRHTTTLGVRENVSRRYTLERHIETVDSKVGEVRKKVSHGHGIVREKYEYEDLARIAREQNMSLCEVRLALGEHPHPTDSSTSPEE